MASYLVYVCDCCKRESPSTAPASADVLAEVSLSIDGSIGVDEFVLPAGKDMWCEACRAGLINVIENFIEKKGKTSS